MSLRKKILELSLEQEAIEAAANDNTAGEETVEATTAAAEYEEADQAAAEDIEATEEASEMEEQVDEQIENNEELIDAPAEPTDAEVVAAEMHLKHFAYRLGMIDNLSTESIHFNKTGTLAFESYSYTSKSNREKLRDVNLALEGFKDTLKNAGKTVIETIKKWIEKIKNFFKYIFSGTYRAYKYVKENIGELKKAISSADKESKEYKDFMEKYSKSAMKLSQALGWVDKDKAKDIKPGDVKAINWAGTIIDFAVKNIEDLKAKVNQIKDDKETSIFVNAEMAARWKHAAPETRNEMAITPTEIANSLDGLITGYEKASGGLANKAVGSAAFICEKVQGLLSKFGSDESKAKNKKSQEVFKATRQYTNAISISSSAINSALVAVAKYGKSIKIKPEEAKAATDDAAKSETADK